MSRSVVTLLLIAVAALVAGAAWAQFGTPNLPSATPWQGDDYDVKAEGRFWNGDNQTWGLFIRGENSDKGDTTLGYFDWEAEGEDPIAGAIRQSDYRAVVVDLKWLVWDSSPRVALRLGADLQVSRSRGTNLDLGASAFGNGPIPAVSLPIEFGDPTGILFLLEPKAVWFDDTLPTSSGGTIEGFGDLIMIGGGARYRLGGQTAIVADAAFPVSGSNTINDVTNEVDKDVVWAVGVSQMFGGWMVDVFATNAAGPTPATSSIAAPDQSVGVGVRVGGAW